MARPRALEAVQAKRVARKRDSTRARLVGAMERLLDGSAIGCDGRLSLRNLAKEAGLSPSRVYGYPDVCEKWKTAIASRRQGRGQSIEDQLKELRELVHKVERTKNGEIEDLKLQRALLLDRLAEFERALVRANRITSDERRKVLRLEAALHSLKGQRENVAVLRSMDKSG